MNEHIDEVKIHGVHATQQTVQKRKAQLVDVSFTFKLTARTIRSTFVQLLNFGEQLRPKGMYTDAIRNSFKIPLTDFGLKLKQLRKQFNKETLEDIRESILNEDFILDVLLLKYLNKGLRRIKDGK